MTEAPRGTLRRIGPGLVLAATGVGAGDMVAAAVSGARFGLAVAWAAVLGALLKMVLNEGLARWQLATGTTLLEGWVAHIGRWFQYLFLCYLVLWSFVVGGALISACGIAAHAVAPGLSVAAWGVLHAVVAGIVVVVGGYASFEKLIKIFIGLMFVTLVGCALVVAPPVETLGRIVGRAGVPAGSPRFILGVIGGVGGSVTLLSYGYWIREKGWTAPERMRLVRLDLGVAYGLTGLFGLAVMVLSGYVLHDAGVEVAGRESVLVMARMLGDVLGTAGRVTFLVGFWGAVATSMLGVWQGVPYLFCDFVGLLRRLDPEARRRMISSRSPWYRGFLVWLAVPPMGLLVFDRPVAVIVVYSVLGALFMPFVAATLLYLNAGGRVPERLRNGWLARSGLIVCLLLFGYLAFVEIAERFA